MSSPPSPLASASASAPPSKATEGQKEADTGSRQIFVITTKPENSLSIATICQLPSNSIVYVLCPPPTASTSTSGASTSNSNSNSTSSVLQQQETIVKEGLLASGYDKAALQEDSIRGPIRVRCFDPFLETVHESAAAIADELSHLKINGILFNPYGSIGSDDKGSPRPVSGLLALAEYKLISSAILLQTLLPLLAPTASVIFAGSESARGLPKMGFPVPNLGTTMESMESFLTGRAYNACDNGPSESGPTTTASSNAPSTLTSTLNSTSSYKWEIAYADTSAIAVLYMKAMARRHPNVYFGTISPGMTQESFNPYHIQSSPTLFLRIQMFLYKYVMFALLKHYEIAKEVSEGAAMFVDALTRKQEYPSGTFVGARGGTGGPVCDQTELDGGKVFLNEEIQDIAFRLVQKYATAK